jgi:hypothetical protein
MSRSLSSQRWPEGALAVLGAVDLDDDLAWGRPHGPVAAGRPPRIVRDDVRAKRRSAALVSPVTSR